MDCSSKTRKLPRSRSCVFYSINTAVERKYQYDIENTAGELRCM